MMEKETDSSSDHGNESKMQLKKAQWAEAAQTLTDTILSNPSDSSLYLSRAVALLKLESFNSAEEDCTRALELDKNSSKAYLGRAFARKCQGKFIGACQDCWELFDTLPDLESESSIVRIEYDKMIGRAIEEIIDLIIENFEEKCHSKTIETLRDEFGLKEKYFGNQLLLQRKYEKAIIKYTNAIRLVPKDPTFYANRALCWIGLGQYRKAENDCTKALHLDNNYEKVLIRRARIRKAMGNLLAAKDDFIIALNLNENNVSIQEELNELEDILLSNTILSKNLKAKENRERIKREYGLDK